MDRSCVQNTTIAQNGSNCLDRYPAGGDAQAMVVFSLVVSLIEVIMSWRLWRWSRIEHSRFAARAAAFAVNGEDGARLFDDEDKKKTKIASLSRLMTLARPQLKLLIAGTISLAFSSGASTIAPLFFGKVIDDAIMGWKNPGDKEAAAALNQTIMHLGFIYIGGAFASFFRSWCFTLAGQRVVAALRRDLFAKITAQEIAFFDTTRTGELLNRLASDTAVIQNACTVNISMLLRYFVQIVGAISIMFGVSWELTLVLLAVVPGVAIGAVIYGKKVKTIQKDFQDRLADAATTAEESISSMRTVKTFANESRSNSEYWASIDKSYEQGALLALVQGGFAGLIGALSSAAIIAVLWYGSTLVVKHEMTTGNLTSFMLYTITVAMAFAFLSSLYGDFMKGVLTSIQCTRQMILALCHPGVYVCKLNPPLSPL